MDYHGGKTLSRRRWASPSTRMTPLDGSTSVHAGAGRGPRWTTSMDVVRPLTNPAQQATRPRSSCSTAMRRPHGPAGGSFLCGRDGRLGFSFQSTAVSGKAVFSARAESVRGRLAPRASAADRSRCPSPCRPEDHQLSAASSRTRRRSSPLPPRPGPNSSDPPSAIQQFPRTPRRQRRPLPRRHTAQLLAHRGIGQRYVTSLHSAAIRRGAPKRHGQLRRRPRPAVAAAADRERVYLSWLDEVGEAGSTTVAVDSG